MFRKKIISYDEYKKISKDILNEYKKYEEDPENFIKFKPKFDPSLNSVPEINKRIIESFSDETKEICRKLISGDIIEKEEVVVIDKETPEELKDKTKKWIKLIGEKFKQEKKIFQKRILKK